VCPRSAGSIAAAGVPLLRFPFVSRALCLFLFSLTPDAANCRPS